MQPAAPVDAARALDRPVVRLSGELRLQLAALADRAEVYEDDIQARAS